VRLLSVAQTMYDFTEHSILESRLRLIGDSLISRSITRSRGSTSKPSERSRKKTGGRGWSRDRSNPMDTRPLDTI
jgi:hypothetical protein